jgi:hypothetical protein
MKGNLIANIREHYLNTVFKDKDVNPDDNIDYEFQINAGAVHYHVFGLLNTLEFFEYAKTRLNIPINIKEVQYKMGEIRYLLQKSHT